MGLREKVTLLLVAVIFQTAHTDCKSQSLQENPFARYVGSRKHQIPTGEPLINSNIHKTFSFPDVEFSLDSSDKEPYTFNTRQINTVKNKKVDPALLESFKKETRRKRKSKKQINEYMEPTQTLSMDTQQSFIIDKGIFPEVEYPLYAMDTWMPKYWNAQGYGTDESFTKKNDAGIQNQPTKSTKPNIYKKLSQIKEIKRPTLSKFTNENKNIIKINRSSEKNSKLKALPPSKRKMDISHGTTTINALLDDELHQPNKHLKVLVDRNKTNDNNKIISKSFQPSIQPVGSKNNSIHSLLNCSDGINITCVTTKIFDVNTDVDYKITDTSFLSNDSQGDNLDSSRKTELISDECLNNDICKPQIQTKVSDTMIPSSVTHESIKSMSKIKMPVEAQTTPNSTHSLQLADYIAPNLQVESASGYNVLTNHNPHTHAAVTVVKTVLENKLNTLQLEKSNSLKLRDLAEKVLAQVGPVPKEYGLPTDFALSQYVTPNLLTDLTNFSIDTISSSYSTNKAYDKHSHTDFTKLYNLVESVLSQIDSQPDNFNIPTDIVSEIITSIDSLPTDYNIPHSAISDKTPVLTEGFPALYDILSPIEMDHIMNDTIQQRAEIYDNKTSDKNIYQILSDNQSGIISNDIQNDSFSYCPLPEIDKCFIAYLPDSDKFSNINASSPTLIELLNGSTFENMLAYPEQIKKETESYTLSDNLKEDHNLVSNYSLLNTKTDNIKNMLNNNFTVEDRPENKSLVNTATYNSSNTHLYDAITENITIINLLTDNVTPKDKKTPDINNYTDVYASDHDITSSESDRPINMIIQDYLSGTNKFPGSDGLLTEKLLLNLFSNATLDVKDPENNTYDSRDKAILPSSDVEIGKFYADDKLVSTEVNIKPIITNVYDDIPVLPVTDDLVETLGNEDILTSSECTTTLPIDSPPAIFDIDILPVTGAKNTEPASQHSSESNVQQDKYATPQSRTITGNMAELSYDDDLPQPFVSDETSSSSESHDANIIKEILNLDDILLPSYKAIVPEIFNNDDISETLDSDIPITDKKQNADIKINSPIKKTQDDKDVTNNRPEEKVLSYGELFPDIVAPNNYSALSDIYNTPVTLTVFSDTTISDDVASNAHFLPNLPEMSSETSKAISAKSADEDPHDNMLITDEVFALPDT